MICIVASISEGNSQSFWFGPYLGPSVGTQQWNTYQKQPIVGYHIGAFVESYDPDNKLNSLYATLGYHQRGSTLRTRYNIVGTNNIFTDRNSFVFNNINLAVGAKREIPTDVLKQFFYTFAIRGEYNLSNNLDNFQGLPNLFFPIPSFVNKFTGGVSFGGGYDWTFSEFYGMYLQFNVSPDFFNQYRAPRIDNVTNPYRPGTETFIPEQQIKNVTLEVTFGIKFLRKVVYI